jgi:hypothetical protein
MSQQATERVLLEETTKHFPSILTFDKRERIPRHLATVYVKGGGKVDHVGVSTA